MAADNSKGWTIERLKLAERLWKAGETAKSIAKRLAEELGAAISRSAVIGTANRRGWPHPKREFSYAAASRAVGSGPVSEPPPLPADFWNNRRKPASFFRSRDALLLAAEGGGGEGGENAPAPAPKRLSELQSRDCRWPLGNWQGAKSAAELSRDPPTEFFCGRHARDGCAYCSEHARSAFTKEKPRVPTALPPFPRRR